MEQPFQPQGGAFSPTNLAQTLFGVSFVNGAIHPTFGSKSGSGHFGGGSGNAGGGGSDMGK